MNTTEFKVGDVVRLRSGSPAMTVVRVTPELIGTVWFNDGNVQVASFMREALSVTSTVNGSYRNQG